MAHDDSNSGKEEATKQVDRDFLNKALNRSVDSKDVLHRVNAQVEEKLSGEGTAKVDRDSVKKYLDAARAGSPAPPGTPMPTVVPSSPTDPDDNPELQDSDADIAEALEAIEVEDVEPFEVEGVETFEADDVEPIDASKLEPLESDDHLREPQQTVDPSTDASSDSILNSTKVSAFTESGSARQGSEQPSGRETLNDDKNDNEEYLSVEMKPAVSDERGSNDTLRSMIWFVVIALLGILLGIAIGVGYIVVKGL